MKMNYKMFIFIGIIAIMAGVFFFTPLGAFLTDDGVNDFLNSIKENTFAPIIFIAIYVLSVVFAVPGVVLTLLAGPLFGLWAGLIYVVLGSNIGCQLTFLISRTFGRDYVKKIVKTDGYIQKISGKVENNGFLIMLYIRLIPFFPFNVINYMMGLTPIKHKDYTLATFLGMLPGSFIYVYLTTKAIDIKDNPLGVIIPVVLLVLLTLVTMLLKKKQKIFKQGESS